MPISKISKNGLKHLVAVTPSILPCIHTIILTILLVSHACDASCPGQYRSRSRQIICTRVRGLGGVLIFSCYIGSAPAATVYPEKYQLYITYPQTYFRTPPPNIIPILPILYLHLLRLSIEVNYTSTPKYRRVRLFYTSTPK